MGVFPRALIIGTAVLSLVVLLVRTRTYWPFTVDDSFITLRYAKHLAEGLGPSWNPSGPAVEGYTTALWMLLLALPHAIGIDALLFAKVAGVVLMFVASCLASVLAYELTHPLAAPSARDVPRGTAGVATSAAIVPNGVAPGLAKRAWARASSLGKRVGRRASTWLTGTVAAPVDARARRVAAIAPLALAIAYWPLSLHAISGMETALVTLLLTLFVLVSVRLVRDPTRRRMRSLSLLALLCALTRPEMGLCCALTLMAVILQIPRTQRRGYGRAVTVYLLLPGLAYFGTRYAYFGLAFPLSLYVKAIGQESLAGLAEVRAFYAPFVWDRPAVGVLIACGIVSQRRMLPALLGMLAVTLFFVYPAHIMGFEGRYLLPLFPSLAALAGVGAGKLTTHAMRMLERMRPLPRLDLAFGVATAVFLAAFALPDGEPVSRARWIDYGGGMERAHVALAGALRKARTSVVRPTIAMVDVGAVAYYSDWYVIDTYGLNDAHVALSRRRDVDYVFAQRPELVVVVSEQSSRFVAVFDWEQPIHDQALNRGYEPLCSYRFLDDYHLQVLARPSSPIRDALACPRLGEALPAARAGLR